MNIEQLPKGALPDPEDKRDYKIEAVGALLPVDWSVEFRLPDPGNEDQGSSDSCVAQAWSYYHTQLHGKNYSRRDLFCRIALNYGAYIRDGGWQVVNSGQATRDEVSDPHPETPQNMRDSSGTKQEYREDDKELNFFSLPSDIDTVASALRAYSGVVFGVTGTNPGWSDLLNPRPPQGGETQWGHALYAMGYHLHSGQKCVIAKSSWCDSVSEHHIKENYFLSGFTFNPWTLIPKDQNMNQTKVVLGKDGKTVYKATPIAEDFENFKKQAGVEGIVVPTPIPPASTL